MDNDKYEGEDEGEVEGEGESDGTSESDSRRNLQLSPNSYCR